METFHFFAAAATIISRAQAPAFLKMSQDVLMLVLAPVNCELNSGFLYIASAGAISIAILLQSASNSSATIIANAVVTPCPISE